MALVALAPRWRNKHIIPGCSPDHGQTLATKGLIVQDIQVAPFAYRCMVLYRAQLSCFISFTSLSKYLIPSTTSRINTSVVSLSSTQLRSRLSSMLKKLLMKGKTFTYREIYLTAKLRVVPILKAHILNRIFSLDSHANMIFLLILTIKPMLLICLFKFASGATSSANGILRYIMVG